MHNLSTRKNAYGFDTVGHILNHLLLNIDDANVKHINPPSDDWREKGVLRKFPQSEFLPQPDIQPKDTKARMKEFGYIYYPKACVEDDMHCNLHVALHNCGFGNPT